MISKSEVYDTDRIIVSKQDIFNLIDRLNVSIYEIMDEYELTQQSRDRAMREKKKEGDKIIWDASRQAEDIYAASVLYTEEALNHLNVMVNEADATVDRMYKEFRRNIKYQQETIRENQLELKSQLQLLADTEKYLRLIEERNREIERERAEKKGRKTLENFGEKHAVIKPEIKINEDYFRKAGIPIEKDGEKPADEEYMEPLEDEGVIESTLKKAAQEIQHLFGESQQEKITEAAPNEDADNPVQAASEQKEKRERGEENGTQEASYVSGGTKDNAAGGQDDNAARSSSDAGGHIAGRNSSDAGGYTAGRDGSDAGGYTAGRDGSDAGGYTAGRDGSDAGGYTAGSGPADSREHVPAGSAAQENASDEPEIKVNLNAEYFKQKRDELDGAEKQPEHNRMSLLDKLMGKKKTLL